MKKLSDYKLLENNPFPAADENSIKRTAENIKRLPKMLELRPIVVDSNNIIQAGNKRYQALLLLGYKEVANEWIVSAKDYSKKELKELILLDNVKEGVWDFEILKIDFPEIDLSSFNIEFPKIKISSKEDLSENIKETYKIEVDCTGEKEQEILYNDLTKKGYSCRLLTL